MENTKRSRLVLGLDLGISSIGWALIRQENELPVRIEKMGVRIIPLSPDDKTEFEQGNAITKNQKRTNSRTQRKGLDRYQLRRKVLTSTLLELGMLPDKKLFLQLSPLEIWGLRARAVDEKISLPELGRIWLHLNQRRGYKHSKTDNNEDTKQTDYVQAVNNRYSYIKDRSETIGQHFYGELRKYFSQEQKDEAAFRIKEKVFPRAAYEEEFDTIWKKQESYYPEILTPSLFKKIRDEIIYYQRKLKSQKGLVSVCEIEGRTIMNGSKKSFVGPKVTPRSSPLFQVEKLWESINNIIIRNKSGETFSISKEKKQTLFNYLNVHEKLTQPELFRILGINKNAGYFTNALIRNKGIQGNLTVATLIEKGLNPQDPVLQFDLEVQNVIDKTTGEITEKKMLLPSFEKKPLYQLWHCIYSLDEADCRRKLKKDFGFDEDLANSLSSIDFTKGGFGNKSARAIRKLLPFLQDGLLYHEAYELAYGKSHSNSLSKEENQSRELSERLELLPKNSLRQPVVEKILNQMINTINAIVDSYGKPDEIRVELARELKQSREERNNLFKANNKLEKQRTDIRRLLTEHPHFRKKNVSSNDITRYRLWEEFGGISPYDPGKTISLAELYSGEYDIEHIIPRSIRFDDSFSNKTICPRRLNSGQLGKNNFTAFDYMNEKRSKEDFDAYIAFIEKAYVNKNISKTKYTNLLTQSSGLVPDFISRSLNETRYITRKSVEILRGLCYEVTLTSGAVTQRLRELWGWDEILKTVNIPKFRAAGLVSMIESTHNGQTHQKEKIEGWTKRDDHRHHAIDALVVACTRQGFIQRINNLNSSHNRQEMIESIKEYKDKLSLLDNFLVQFKPFDTASIMESVHNIMVSFKPGKKVAVFSARKINKAGKKDIVQRGILTPRGPLSEESVYGKIMRKISRRIKLDKNFSSADSIIDIQQRDLVKERLAAFENKPQLAFRDLKKNPIWSDKEKSIELTHVEISDYVEEFVIKYPVSSIQVKDIPFIVDREIREILAERLAAHGGNHKDAFKNLEENPVWFNREKKIPIRSVRLFTNLSRESLQTIKVHDRTWNVEYEKYVKPGSNHHIAIYEDESGKRQEHVVSFWHAVERKKYGIPVIIKDPTSEWSKILAARELPQAFLQKLPGDKWRFITSMQQNDSFVFGMSRSDLEQAIKAKNYSLIGPNIFRVRKLTKGSFWFNQQYETEPREALADKRAKRCIQASLGSMTGIRVKINNIGEVFLHDE